MFLNVFSDPNRLNGRVIFLFQKNLRKWLFSEWDSNDDGLVSGDEFKECLTKLCALESVVFQDENRKAPKGRCGTPGTPQEADLIAALGLSKTFKTTGRWLILQYQSLFRRYFLGVGGWHWGGAF